jgi:hypothetical protein
MLLKLDRLQHVYIGESGSRLRVRLLKNFAVFGGLYGAGERFRTVDLVLGKHTLYQLSYTRSPERRFIVIRRVALVNASCKDERCI